MTLAADLRPEADPGLIAGAHARTVYAVFPGSILTSICKAKIKIKNELDKNKPREY